MYERFTKKTALDVAREVYDEMELKWRADPSYKLLCSIYLSEASISLIAGGLSKMHYYKDEEVERNEYLEIILIQFVREIVLGCENTKKTESLLSNYLKLSDKQKFIVSNVVINNLLKINFNDVLKETVLKK